jgi:hypothetical protein
LQHRFHEELVSTKSCLWRRKRKLSAEAAVLMNKRTVHMLDKQSKVRIINQSINQSINRVLDHFHLPGIVPRKVVAIPTMVSVSGTNITDNLLTPTSSLPNVAKQQPAKQQQQQQQYQKNAPQNSPKKTTSPPTKKMRSSKLLPCSP